jgi:amino-acid N-acetyltransferase
VNPSIPTAIEFVAALRGAAPYVHGHNGRTFVIAFPGEICARDDVDRFLADIALLSSLGVRLVLVHGARPQIEAELQIRGIEPRLSGDLRVTDPQAMSAVKAAVGVLRLDIEARLSSNLITTAMAGAKLRVVGGTWVVARPVGVRNGIDHQLTGEVRRVDIAEIRQMLAADRVVLLSPVGYSPTGEAFNLRSSDIAQAVATGLGADKLVFILGTDPGQWRVSLSAADNGELSLAAAQTLETEVRKRGLSTEDRQCVMSGLAAVRDGVRRVHLIPTDGVSPLLRELYTRDGCGLMISADDDYESTRPATLEDVAGIAELIRPLERAGILLPRSRDQLERDIGSFFVMLRDNMIIACYSLIQYPHESSAEFACVAVHPDYRGQDIAASLLRRARTEARGRGLRRLFALTTRTTHWFLEHGFVHGSPDDLPTARRSAYDGSARNSLVLVDEL